MKVGIIAMAVLLAAFLWPASAPAQDGQMPDMNRQGSARPPLPKVLAALDMNSDGVIDADEIADAAFALMQLDKNDDGQLSADEFTLPLPPQPPGGSGPNGNMPPPQMPVETALDANGDGTIDAAEITNAPTTLAPLDKNGDGQLTMDECMPAQSGKK